MMTLSPSKLATIIIRARKFDADIPGSGKARELKSFIAALNEDEQAELTAIMWIGRDTYEPEDLDEAIEMAKTEATVPTEDYLLDNPLLADHLEMGADALGIDLDAAEEETFPTV
ncbi:DUF3775 domain-containing protein [Thioclava sp. GXIMD4216]|uniref:DUF3775 domain-containing protein n=1 Tax=Thioclava litoralis TaxID=3076557 RepID=A0ABZ1E2K4_9RHOB|nr:DUF3775 domain-containing protein [Thioclava sp. FTW29]